MDGTWSSMQTAAVYIRVSTDDQLELSPESQLAEISKYAREHNILIAQEYIFIESEGRSGRNSKNRPQFQQMIATAKVKPKPFDCILLWKYSRFARNQDESTFYKSMLRKKLGIDVISISEPLMEGMYGRLIEMIIEWQDEFYSYNLSVEVKRSMRLKAEKGLYNGSSSFPLGYVSNDEKKPVIDEQEAHVIRTIFDFYVNGYDKNYILRFLNNSGYRTKRGNKFTQDSIDYILGNPFYIGKVRWNRRESSHSSRLKPAEEWIISDADHEALISPEIFEKAQKRNKELLAVHSRYAHPISHGKHWLSGMVKCSLCGKSLSIKHRKDSPYSHFQCLGYRNGLHKESQSISEMKLTAYVLDSLKEVLTQDSFDFEIIRSEKDYQENTLLFYQNELKKLSIREERMKTAYMDGVDSLDEYKKNKDFIQQKKLEIEEQIRALEQKQDPEKDMREKMKKNIENTIEILEDPAADQTQKANALRSITKKIVFFKDAQALAFHYYIML